MTKENIIEAAIKANKLTDVGDDDSVSETNVAHSAIALLQAHLKYEDKVTAAILNHRKTVISSVKKSEKTISALEGEINGGRIAADQAKHEIIVTSKKALIALLEETFRESDWSIESFVKVELPKSTSAMRSELRKLGCDTLEFEKVRYDKIKSIREKLGVKIKQLESENSNVVAEARAELNYANYPELSLAWSVQ